MISDRVHNPCLGCRLTSAPAVLFCLCIALLALTGCGSSSGSSGSGGGGGGNGPQITLISPSMVMSDINIALFTVIGSGFTSQSQVLIDGNPTAFPVMVEDAQHIQVNLPGPPAVGVHQITVQNGSQVSNSSAFTYYAPAAAPGGLFQAFPGYYAGPEYSVNLAVVGDFNGDGLDDVMIGGAPAGEALLLGQSDGSLAWPQYLPNISATLAGDLDGNGTVDIVALGGTACAVFLNNGKASFTPGPACPNIPVYGTSVLVDVNGDGLPDLIVAGASSSIVVLLNQSGAQFAAPVTLASTGNSSSFAVAKFNGDTLPDIAYNAAGASGTTIHILKNQGNGTFTDTIPSGLQGASGSLVAADFNVDGIQDLVVESVNSSQTQIGVQTFLGQGNNAFTLASTTTLTPEPFNAYQFVAGDFDHDGFPDLVGTNGGAQPSYLLYLWNDGTGAFTAEARNGPQGFTLAVGDINGDGLPDIVVPDEFNEISVVLGQTNRNYVSPDLLIPVAGPNISIADVNGDGLPDLLIGDSVVINQGNSSFAAPVALSSSVSAIAIADLNGDGLADLIGEQGDDIQIWPGTGNPSFPGSPIVYTPPVPVFGPEVQIADMDHDGHLDLVSPGIILYGNGQFGFTPVQVAFSAPFVLGDFNGDGYLDIATNGQTWLGGPNRTFTSVPNVLDMSDGASAAVGVFGGNGVLDIATTDGSIYYGTGKGDFYYQGEFTADAPMGGIVVGDFNHDGLPDIAVGLQLPQQIAVFINDGQGGFERSYYASGAETYGMAGGDFNGDGKTDLVVCNYVVDFALPNALVIFGQ